MKKHNEGYALVLVLVVITVLSLVAMAMTAASLRNLQNQQKSIERMEAKYTAQGEIEKAIVGFEEKIKYIPQPEGTEIKTIVLKQSDNLGGMCDYSDIKVTCLDIKYGNEIEGDLFNDHDYLIVELETTLPTPEDDPENPPLQVNCQIKITGKIDANEQTGTFVVELKDLQWHYVSYTITEKEAVTDATE